MLNRFYYAVVVLLQGAAVLQVTSGKCQADLQPDHGRLSYNFERDGKSCNWELPTISEGCAVLMIKIEAIQLEFNNICSGDLYVPMETGFSRRCQFMSGECYVLYDRSVVGSRQEKTSFMEGEGRKCSKHEWHPFNGTFRREIRVQIDSPMENPYMELTYEFSHCTKVVTSDYPVQQIIANDADIRKDQSSTDSCTGLIVAVGILSCTTICSLAWSVYIFLRRRSPASRTSASQVYSFADDENVHTQSHQGDAEGMRDEQTNELYRMEELQMVGDGQEPAYSYIKS